MATEPNSFEGLPPPNPEKYPQDEGQPFHLFKELSIPLEEVQGNFKKFNLLDDQVVFLKGWFKDTLPKACDQTAFHTSPRWGFIRVDYGCPHQLILKTLCWRLRDLETFVSVVVKRLWIIFVRV